MKSKFYIFDSGYREDETWDTARKNMQKACKERGAHLTLEKSNAELIHGLYREKAKKIITIFDIEGNPRVVELENFSSCEFLLHRSKQTLIVKNPKRGTIGSLISLLQDTSDFQFFAESRVLDLWQAIRSFAQDENSTLLSRVELTDHPYAHGLIGSITIDGQITFEKLQRFRNGKLSLIQGQFGKTLKDRFVLHSRGILKISGNMSFKEALDFLNWRDFT